MSQDQEWLINHVRVLGELTDEELYRAASVLDEQARKTFDRSMKLVCEFLRDWAHDRQGDVV